MDKLKVVILTGNQPRHSYLINHMNEKFDVVGLITEPHHDYFNSQREESELVRKHFRNLQITEKEYFYSPDMKLQMQYLGFPNHKKLKSKEINNIENIEWVKSLNPNYILLYGTGILNSSWFEEFDDRIINLHLGMSPYYRGSATLFWPFYNNELKYLGVTIHIATEKVDAGDILYIVKPDIKDEDNYYDITNKLIKKAIKKFSYVVYSYDKGDVEKISQDISKQKYYYKKKDFSEECLKKVLDEFWSGNVISS